MPMSQDKKELGLGPASQVDCCENSVMVCPGTVGRHLRIFCQWDGPSGGVEVGGGIRQGAALPLNPLFLQCAAGGLLQDPSPPACLVTPYPPHHRHALWLWGALGPGGHSLAGPNGEGRIGLPPPQWTCELGWGGWQVLG